MRASRGRVHGIHHQHDHASADPELHHRHQYEHA
jgi:hypothetical protein